MDAKPSHPFVAHRGRRGLGSWSPGLIGLLLGVGALLPACSSNNDAVGPTFPAKVTGDAIGGPGGTVFVQVTVNPGSVDRGRRASVVVLVTNLNGFPLAGRRVTLTPSAGRLDQASGVTGPDGTFSTTIFIPCEVPPGAVTINAIVDGSPASLPGALTVVTATSNDPCAGIIPPAAGGGATTGGGGGVVLPTVTVTSAGLASETGPTTATFTVSRTGSNAAPLSVTFGMTGSALLGTDYGLTGSGVVGTTVTIPAGSSSATITLNPVDDAVDDPDDPSGPDDDAELAILTITPSGTYTVGSPGAAQLEIEDND